MSEGHRNGSFRVSIPVARNQGHGNVLWPNEYEQIDTVYHTVQMATQNDYAEGWRQVVPRVSYRTKKVVDESGIEKEKTVSNIYRMKVNLAQLPQYLWHRMRYQYYDDTHTVRNGMYYYKIEKTPVDDEIRELVDITNRVVQEEYRYRVQELLNILKDNDIYGWAIIRAKNMYNMRHM
jgi:hypothetical protein